MTPDASRARQVPRAASVSPQPAQTPAKDPASPTKDPASPTKSPAELPAPAPTNRKRTSSGVFQVDETEPPPKKPEANGRKESKKEAKKGKQEKKVIKRFDATADTKCVSAFKESDTWD